MSWASKRDTTRVEDTAYSLLGLFSVHMPLLYGEGTQAFTRLQEEIMKTSDDQSLFAWTASGEDPNDVTFLPPYKHPVSGLLAASPSQFVLAKDIIPFRSSSSSTFSTTNKGLQITLPLYPVDRTGFSLAILSCRHKSSPEPLGIHLHPLYPSRARARTRTRINTTDDHFARCRDRKALIPVSRSKVAHATLRTIFIRNRPVAPSPADLDRKHAFFVRTRPHSSTGYALTRTWPPSRWRPQQSLFPAPTRKAALFFENVSHGSRASDRIMVMLRVDLPSSSRPLKHATPTSGASTPPLLPPQSHQFPALPTPTLALNVSPNVDTDPLATDTRALSAYVLPKMAQLATHGTHKTFAELCDGRRVIAEISCETWLGEEMFVVDVEVVGCGEGIFEVEGDCAFTVPDKGDV